MYRTRCHYALRFAIETNADLFSCMRHMVDWLVLCGGYALVVNSATANELSNNAREANGISVRL